MDMPISVFMWLLLGQLQSELDSLWRLQQYSTIPPLFPTACSWRLRSSQAANTTVYSISCHHRQPFPFPSLLLFYACCCFPVFSPQLSFQCVLLRRESFSLTRFHHQLQRNSHERITNHFPSLERETESEPWTVLVEEGSAQNRLLALYNVSFTSTVVCALPWPDKNPPFVTCFNLITLIIFCLNNHHPFWCFVLRVNGNDERKFNPMQLKVRFHHTKWERDRNSTNKSPQWVRGKGFN